VSRNQFDAFQSKDVVGELTTIQSEAPKHLPRLKNALSLGAIDLPEAKCVRFVDQTVLLQDRKSEKVNQHVESVTQESLLEDKKYRFQLDPRNPTLRSGEAAKRPARSRSYNLSNCALRIVQRARKLIGRTRPRAAWLGACRMSGSRRLSGP